jgi:cyclic beta-1,2-glucan synthetase
MTSAFPLASPPETAGPIRGEIFSTERLEQLAESLAASHVVRPGRHRGQPLLRRLEENGRALLAAYREIAGAALEEEATSPAAEWLVDNFHIVEEQVREVREDLPAGFYRELPKLASGALEGLPRVYGLTWAFIEHTDSRVEGGTLARFVRAYQRAAPLTIGELWAVPISLRLVLIENLRRIFDQNASRRGERRAADALADKLLAAKSPEAEAKALPRFERRPLSRPFAARLLQRLRDHEPAGLPAAAWVEHRLAEHGMKAEDVLRLDQQEQAAAPVTVRHLISSMRLISALDWNEFFESVSLVDKTLRQGTRVAEMDFVTRDRYRQAIEDVSRGSGRPELEVARRAVGRARAAVESAALSGKVPNERLADPGYWLISKGREDLEKELGYRAPVLRRPRRAVLKAATPVYIGTVAASTMLVLAAPLAFAANTGASLAVLALLSLLAIVPASDLAVAVINRLVTSLLGPRRLPKLELKTGVPPELRTLVATPALLTDETSLADLVERLEIHFLGNPDGDIRFALVTDWADAEHERNAADETLLAGARERIAELNARHGPAPGGGDRFLLFHRRRVFNGSEGAWIGWERKRGKLHELDRLLRGAQDTTFLAPGPGASAAPADVRYVITLDADTRLLRDGARYLVGTMAHPLNRPVADTSGRVIDGHALLQPRVSPMLPPAGKETLHQWIFSGNAGIDPYAFAVSDVYQDLFGEAIYTGKGIYEVDAFEHALEGHVPQNALLSHDLFEGLFARAGFVSDVELFENYPSSYAAAALRQHRWARGDWQLLPWLKKHVRGADGRLGLNPIPAIGRWKILDNLRRSLSAPAALATLAAAWLLPGIDPLPWIALVLASIGGPVLVLLVTGLGGHRGLSKRSYLRGIGTDLARAIAQAGLRLALLADQAWLMADAVVRTLTRIAITRRHLLEWTPAADVQSRAEATIVRAIRRQSGALALAAILGGLVAALRPGALAEALPFLVVWLLAPLVTWAISRPTAIDWQVLPPQAVGPLRRIARRTWLFFETFAGSEDHGLPCDNFQEVPQPVAAHRTSPTNMGLLLLSTVAARDMGWIGAAETAERLTAALESMDKLERYRGHFFNWYDTRSLAPLDSKYVSTVDSGNLAAHLVAVRQACLEGGELETPWPVLAAGIADALSLLHETSADRLAARRDGAVTRRQLAAAIAEVEASLAAQEGAGPTRLERLRDLDRRAGILLDMVETLASEQQGESTEEALTWARAVRRTIASHSRDGIERDATRQRLAQVASAAEELFAAMDFTFLYDTERRLFSIGYRLSDGRLDPGYYDLLASEARLASFLAIAQEQVPTAHWFRLGRALTPVGRGSALVSWSGSMFEYLMPDLVMDVPPKSLLGQTNRLVVARQIRYGSERQVPWGVSESAFNARDLEFTYQYSNFGLSGLGLKRGLSEDLVIAPYATALAAMIAPAEAAANFKRLAQAGGLGRYGFYEALDYTPSRLPEGESVAVVKTTMAHHQGMTIVALANVLSAGSIRRRFHADPAVGATELLLQERTPRAVAVARPRVDEVRSPLHVRETVPPVLRRFLSPHDPTPRAQLLSNGRYTVGITAAGSGFSRWRGRQLTRWHEDVTRDDWGSWIYLRDGDSGEVWSAGYQPTGTEPDSYEAVFSEDRAEIRRRDGTLLTALQVVVSAEDDAELRQVSITNLGTRVRRIFVTSYAELALAPTAADEVHPAFSNLFVQTEFVPGPDAIVATRRPREPDEPPIWLAHVSAVDGETLGAVQYETDRARFLGRGRGVRQAVCEVEGRPLSNTTGPVLDPVASLRRRLRLLPGATARVLFATVAASSRAGALALIDKHRELSGFERTAELAWTHAQAQLRHLTIGPDEAHLFQRLASRLLYVDATLRASPEVLQRNRQGVSALWTHGISGDLPIALVRIDDVDDQGIVRQLLLAQEYWRIKGLAVDLVILEEQVSYPQDLRLALEALVHLRRRAPTETDGAKEGGVFLLSASRLSQADRDVLRAAARVVLLSRQGTLAEQVVRLLRAAPAPSPPHPRPPLPSVAELPPPRPDLEFFNGLGGFAGEGREYTTILGEGQWTPAPWINVVANPSFGFLVSESGSGYTWSGNSRENRLTPWSNDPVTDAPGEALLVRDDETGEIWGPTALPVRDAWPYVIRHGQGYSRFEHESRGIALELLQFVPLQEPVKVSRLRVKNRSSSARRLTVAAYAEWVLGVSRAATVPFTVTKRDEETGAIFATNVWNEDFGGGVAFADLGGRQTAWTADRTEFIGRNGRLDSPSGLAPGVALSGRAGAGLDPCAALSTSLELSPGAEAEVVFLLGQGADSADARRLVRQMRAANLDAALDEVRRFWDDTLGALQVKTPDRSMDLMLNRWLLYQALACRVWARAAFYQSSGAFGFRDQLQDVMALSAARRDVVRQHLLRAASRQFAAGDVQHWWHEPSGRGVRTRISDDLLWLPHALVQFIEVTGDRSVLDETVPFLEGAPLAPGETERYFAPRVSVERATVFEHAARALDRSLAVGRHGLPLMGTGDWNDGMNRVGAGGHGESVWLAWFLHSTLWEFAGLAEQRGEMERASRWRAHVEALGKAVEAEGWDGDWYRRAFFDDGTPLGSSSNDECRIDSVAQSWGVISGAADPQRCRRAMAALEEYLVRRGDGLVLLLTPPFDKMRPDPGYIKGYLPGVRENGGQYTHAALWAVIAFAALGEGDKAGELFALLNPINHASTRSGLHRYKVEPYVAAADIYAEPPHVGRGGWTWYTGSAGWMYRAGIEWILGFRLRGTRLHIDPCIPRAWPGYEVTFRYHSARYRLTVENPHGSTRGVARVGLDGQPVEGREISLSDDGRQHEILVVLA